MEKQRIVEITKIITERLENYDEVAAELELRIQRRDRLKTLTRKYNVELVARAAGLTVGTLQQYLRVSMPTAISEKTVTKAEKMLKGL